jgi:protein-tyrosine-phosphatase/DNA-binding transcriptional ArsR family regulator
VRSELVTLLASGDHRVNELVDSVAEPQNLVSYHLGLLRRAGLVTERRSSADARDVYYHLDLKVLEDRLDESASALHPALARLERPRLPVRSAGRAPRVLFICSGNSARSQMAEAILRSVASKAVEVSSAGPRPASIHPLAMKVLSERGLSTAGLRSKGLEELAGVEFDYVISLCDIAREECPPRPERPEWIHWSLPDPAAVTGSPTTRLKAFRHIAEELDVRISQLIPVLAR